ncbi:MAG: peptidylprolyl isomerase [Rhodocyclaceae bacterium]|nr:peptidylprolyl isomerase [Rhodocyclaceae bacterium]
MNSPYSIFRIATVALLLATSLAASAQGTRITSQDVDRILAVVNDEAITLLEHRNRLATVERQLRSQNVSLPAREVLEQQLLERMISDRVQLQLARETGMRVPDIELDSALRRIAENNRMSLSDFQLALQKDGVTWGKFREDIRDEMTLSRLREREVDARIVISEGEIDNYLANPIAAVDANPEVALAHILVRVPEQATPDQLMRIGVRAQSALDQIRRGEDFARVAASFSDAPDGLSGGAMSARPLDRLPGLYAEAVRKLQPGEVSEVLRSPAGFHIVKLVERRGSTVSVTAGVRQTRARHILIKVGDLVTVEDARRKIMAIKEKLTAGADFAEIARMQSNDLSAAKGGELGWLYQGDTVPEFDQAMDALALNQVSNPVQSQFGFHLIQVLERRTEQASPERQRAMARQILRERKSDEAYQDWIRQMRDRAYVELRTDER